jgi:cytoskeletal protein CcmA (bactofilin family)
MKFANAIKFGLTGTVAALTLMSGQAAMGFEEFTLHKGTYNSDLIVSADKLAIEADIATDLIAAGGEVRVKARVGGDALVVGGRVDFSRQVEGGLMLMGGDANLEADVQESVSLFAGKADTKGNIKGDVLAIGGKLVFEGDINGDLSAAAGKLDLRKQIGGNVLATAGLLTIADGASVGGKATIGAGKVRINGHIVGDLRVGASEVIITGRIDGNAKIAARTIRILPSARIAGNLVYHSPQKIQLSDQAEIGGDVTFMQSEGMSEREGGLFALAGATHIILVIGLALLATVFVFAVPKLFPALDRQSRGRNLTCVGLGLAVLVGIPLLISVLFVSAIGVPLAILLIAAYFVTVITGQFGSSYVLGRRVLSFLRHDSTRKPLHRVGATVLGLALLWVLALVPVLGGIVIVLATARGVGALVFEIVELRARLGQPA